MARTPTLPLGISIRGAPLPRLANRGFKGIKVRLRRDGTVVITERPSGTMEARLVAFFQEFMPLFWFMVAWATAVFGIGAAFRFDERVMFPLGVLGGPAFFMWLMQQIHPRLRAMPAVGLQLTPAGWLSEDVAEGSVELPRALAATAQVVVEADGQCNVVVETSTSGRRGVVASHLSTHDANRLAELLKEYGRKG